MYEIKQYDTKSFALLRCGRGYVVAASHVRTNVRILFQDTDEDVRAVIQRRILSVIKKVLTCSTLRLLVLEKSAKNYQVGKLSYEWIRENRGLQFCQQG